MQAKPVNAADYIAAELSRRGVRFVFGIPGGPSIPYLDAFRRQGIRFILTSNEAAAAIMADVTGRLTGLPGICHATFGPGAVNLASGIGGALLDRSPVIAFTSEMPDRMAGRTTQMNIDHQALFRPLTKKTVRLVSGSLARDLDTAFRIAREEYPGPVHLGLPADLAGKSVIPSGSTETTGAGPVPEWSPGEAGALLARSRKPILAVGLTARRLGAGPALLRFLAKHPMPVFLTPMAKGLVGEDHPCYAGVLFHALSSGLAAIHGRADLVIGFGYDPVEYNFESWMPEVPLVSINTIPVDMPSGLVHTQVTGDLETGLERLSGIMPAPGSGLIGEITRFREASGRLLEPLGERFGPVSALRILMEELPVDTVVTGDVGSHLHLMGGLWRTADPDRLIMTNGWSSMGFGLPAALAAQLEYPDRPVACITGDGGFLMMMGELATASRYHLPVKVVVMADRELNLIRLKEQWMGIEPVGTGLYRGNMLETGRILGARVFRAVSSGELRSVLGQAMQIPEPVVIETCIDPSDYAFLLSR